MAGRGVPIHVMAGGSADSTDPPPSPEREALAWLYGFSDWERGLGWSKDAAPEEQWMLGRTRALLDLAGAPDRALRIVHVAGTKGKGSTIAYLESIVQAAGWRSGAYTQPHLHEFRERIRLDGQPIPSEAFTRGVDRLHGLVGPLGQQHPEAGAPTTFELTTVLATLAFAEAGVDVALMEVGLGGRLDATNALDTDLAVITPIGLDHRQILGNTLAKIAAEKAAIIRPGQRVLSARQRPSAAGVIARRCAEVDATFRVVDPLRATRGLPPRVHGRLTTGKLFRAALGLAAGLHAAGRHQCQNAGLAVAAAEALAADGLPLTVEAVERGLAEAWLPARLELVSRQPDILVDAAHNVDSARALADELRRWEARPLWLVLGILRDKDASAILRVLLPLADGVIVTTPRSPRALPAEVLATACRAVAAIPVEVAASVSGALGLARERAGATGGMVVAGSFSTATEARVALGLTRSQESGVRRGKRPSP